MIDEIDESLLVNYAVAVDPRRNRRAQWTKAVERLIPEAWPEVAPKFTLGAGATIFTVGSCFARNIEEHVARLGYDVPMLGFETLPGEWDGRPADILNKYTLPSIYQEVRWAADIFARDRICRAADCASLFYDLGDGRVIDHNLAGFIPVSHERFVERRGQIYAVFEKLFTADCVVITPGLIEAWYDETLKIFIQQSPGGTRLFPERIKRRVKFCLLNYGLCLSYFRATIDAIAALNGKAKFLVTTSPVPLYRTFTTDDVIVANSYAKSVLRAACGEMAQLYPSVDYFPSYENVMLTREWAVFQPDRIHVASGFVGKIVARMARTYFTAAEAEYRFFQESCAKAEEGALDAAAELAEKALALRPDNAEFKLHAATLAVRCGKPDRAIELLSQLAAGDGGSAQVLKLLAAAYERKRDRETALATVDAAIALAPNDASLRDMKGRFLVALRRYAEAENVLRRALELNPAMVGSYEQLTVALLKLDRPAEALAVARRGIEYAPQRPSMRARLAEAHRAVGALGDAAAQYGRILVPNAEVAGFVRSKIALIFRRAQKAIGSVTARRVAR